MDLRSLQTLNAHFNFTRLGVVVEEYEENIYGNSASPLHQGAPTDRFIAQWRLTAPHVERRLSRTTAPLMRDSSVMTAVLVNPSLDGGEWLEPGEPALGHADARRLLVEIPAGFTEMQARRPELARAWRMATRTIFRTYLARGFRVVDFFLAGDATRGQPIAREGGVRVPGTGYQGPGRRAGLDTPAGLHTPFPAWIIVRLAARWETRRHGTPAQPNVRQRPVQARSESLPSVRDLRLPSATRPCRPRPDPAVRDPTLPSATSVPSCTGTGYPVPGTLLTPAARSLVCHRADAGGCERPFVPRLRWC